MHVTKFKTRYLVRLLPSEYEALCYMHDLACQDITYNPNGTTSHLSGSARKQIIKGRIGSFTAFDVDQDRSND